MGIKIIMLLVVIAYTCTANNYDSDRVPEVQYLNETTEENASEITEASPVKSRCRLSNGSYIEVYYSDCPRLTLPRRGAFLMPHEPLEDWFYDNLTIEIPEPKIGDFSKKWNNISVKSDLFLEGLIVTHTMPLSYIFILLLSLPLNALALVMFTCKIQAKKPAVIYMSHLACVDLLFTLLLPLNIHYRLNNSDWVFGEVACRMFSTAYFCYMYCSILLMMCISVDRLLAVALPITSLTWRSTRKASCVCVLVWLMAIAGTVPLLSMRQTVTIKGVGVSCRDVLDENDSLVLYYAYLFSILSCLYYFLPLVITSVSYFTIIYVLSAKSKHVAPSSPSGIKRKAVIMAIAVLIEFVVCFAPTNGIRLYHGVLLATGGNNEVGGSSFAAYMLAMCLGSTSVFLDPLLYYYGSSQCRQQIRSVFRCRKAKRENS